MTVTAAGGGVALPYGVSVTPPAGSGVAGAAQNLQFAWASPAGYPGIGSSSILIQDSTAPAPSPGGTFSNACYLAVSTTGATSLADDTGLSASFYSWVGYGYAISPSNSHCALNGPASSQVAGGIGGATEQVTLNLTFSPAWKGRTLSIWMQSQNTNYKSGTWQQLGTFAVH